MQGAMLHIAAKQDIETLLAINNRQIEMIEMIEELHAIVAKLSERSASPRE